MKPKTVGELRAWLNRFDEEVWEPVFLDDWIIRVTAGGNIDVHPPGDITVGASFCPYTDDEVTDD